MRHATPPHRLAPRASARPLTCTPGEVTETLLGRTRTWTHLLSSSAKPCGAEAPGQAPSRQHLRGIRPEPVMQPPQRALARGVMEVEGRGASWPSPHCQATVCSGLVPWGPRSVPEDGGSAR